MSKEHSSTDNASITIDGVRAYVKVWRRPDLDSATGARLAGELGDLLKALPTHGVREVSFDFREAPPVAGPKTTATLGEMFAGFDAANIRLSVIVGDHSVQALQFRRLVSERIAELGRVVFDETEADAWLSQR